MYWFIVLLGMLIVPVILCYAFVGLTALVSAYVSKRNEADHA